MKTNYDLVINYLESRIDELVNEIKARKKDQIINEKLQFDMAIKWLKKGMQYQIDPNSAVTILPNLKTSTPSSEYRIIEDHESDDQMSWEEVKINGTELRPNPGDFIIENKH